MDDEVHIDEIAEQESNFEGAFPLGFGKQDKAANIQAQLERARRKVEEHEEEKRQDDKGKSNRSSDDDSNSDSDDSDDTPEFPVTHELVIPTHERPVTSATLDASGNRLITGSSDCTIKYHDLASIGPTTVRAFREVDPTATKHSQNNETHPIHQVLFNPISPSSVLVITGLPQVKIFDREGEPWGTTVKGDMYLRDKHNTKGHTSEITSGDWHPLQRQTFATASTDSTIRIWDINNLRQQQHVIVHKSKRAGTAGLSRITAVKYGSSVAQPSIPSTPILAATAYDGTLSLWEGNGPFLRPSASVPDAHTPETWTSSLDISPDGRLIVTRGGDDMLKTWDTRKLKTPLRTTSHPSTSAHFPTSTVRFSPSGSQVLLGDPTGNLHILNTATLRPELITPIAPGTTVTTAFWHPKLNQIIATTSNGRTHILFAPEISHGGALAVMSKPPKTRHIDDDPARVMDTSMGFSPDAIVNPAERQPRAGRKQAGVTNTGKPKDPRRPHIPEATPFQNSTPDERHVRESVPLSSMRDEDPREALLKYANMEGDRRFTKAWEKTQPTAVFAEREDEGEEPEAKRVKR